MLVEEALEVVLEDDCVEDEKSMLVTVGFEEGDDIMLLLDKDEVTTLLLEEDVLAAVDVETGGVYVAGVTPRTEARIAASVPLLAELPLY